MSADDPPAGGGAGDALAECRRLEEALRETEQRFRALAEATPQIVCALRPDGNPEYVNAPWTEYSGLSFEETARVGWLGVVHPDDVPAMQECWRRARARGATEQVELRYRAASGAYRWFLSRLVPVKDARGRVVRWIGAAIDIDDRKRAETEREALLASLTQADRRKDEFLAVLSHELRNPLASLATAAAILDRAAQGTGEAALAKGVIARQVDHLARLVDDLLDVTRISRGKIQLRKAAVELGAVVGQTVEDHRALFASQRIALRASAAAGELWVEGDPTRLAQVVGNLLSNAAKFTEPGGEVTVTVGGEEEGWATVRVADTGLGISAALLERVFEPFVQADHTVHRARGGLGLGLALVKGLVEKHAGTVEARSEGPGRGSTFTMRLPLRGAPQAPPPVPPAAPAPSAAPRRVLLVEDDDDAAESLRLLLEMAGHEVTVARDGEEGISKARALRPDAVLCDLGLPGKDGFEVARALRASTELAGTALVALTGYASPDDRRRAAEAGFDAHLGKPASLEEIERALVRAARGEKTGPGA